MSQRLCPPLLGGVDLKAFLFLVLRLSIKSILTDLKYPFTGTHVQIAPNSYTQRVWGLNLQHKMPGDAC